MAKRTWNKDEAGRRIDTRLAEVGNVTIKEYVRDTDLSGIGKSVAYRVNGVHLYIDILNMDEMLGVTDYEGVVAHRRTLRFLNLHYRAVRNVLLDVGAIQVDFHNQRLHAVFAKPYGDEAARIHKAVATAQLICDVLAKTGEEGDDPLPAAKTRVGIDSGKALAVNNGRHSSREPLFLGEPANEAAKRAGGGTKTGIYATNNVRKVVGWADVEDTDLTGLTSAQVQTSQEKAKLDVSVDDVIKQWNQDLANSPIGKIEFYRHTPPFQTIDLEALTPKNSRRQEATSLYADIDNFTRYVADRISDDAQAKHVVKALHVLRAELDSVLYSDFAGCKIRFIGDCIHGLMVEGTAQTTEDAETVTNAILCAAAMRSSFELAQEKLKKAGVDCGSLGLAIGLEHGPLAITRLGVKGEMIRCSISRSVLRSEEEQRRCDGTQTAIGPTVAKFAPTSLKDKFGGNRRCSSLRYDVAVKLLDDAAKSESSSARTSLLRPATSAPAAASVAGATSSFTFGSTAAKPSSTPAGFS